MRRAVPAAILLVALVSATAAIALDSGEVRTARAGILWRESRAVGEPFDGRLIRGVQLPPEGKDWLTWDPILDRRPNRGWRRWGTDDLLRVMFGVIRRYRSTHSLAPRVLIGDLSRRHGGDFGRRFGGIGHASHQNGLDVDVLYPRRDRSERAPHRPGQVDPRLAQALVREFVRAGAQYVFVGPSLPLRGPRGVVQPLVNHDDHMHVRLYNPDR